MANNTSGYVYVLSNPSFVKNILKIGRTQSLSDRIKSLSNTSVPFDYELKLYLKVPIAKYKLAEKQIHDLLKGYQVSKEFYNCPISEVRKKFEQVAKLCGGKVYQYVKGDKDKQIYPPIKRKP